MTAVPEWNDGPIPDTVRRILVWKGNGGEEVAHKIEGNWKSMETGCWLTFKTGFDPRYAFTHWIPLPGPPEGFQWDEPWGGFRS